MAEQLSEAQCIEETKDGHGEEERQMRSFFDALREEDVQRVVPYTNARSQTYAAPLWQMMGHLVNHGTQRRSGASEPVRAFAGGPGCADISPGMRSIRRWW